MLHGNAQKVFRIIIGIVFLGVGVKYCVGGDFLLGVISLGAGAAFIASLFLKRNGKNE